MATPVRCTCSSMYLQCYHDHALQCTFSSFHPRPLNSCYAHQLINEDFPAEWFPMSMIVIFFLGASSFKPRVSAIEISPCSGSAYNVWHSCTMCDNAWQIVTDNVWHACTMCDNVWHSWTLSFSFSHLQNPFIECCGGRFEGVGRIGRPPRFHFPRHSFPLQVLQDCQILLNLNEYTGTATKDNKKSA